MQQSHFEPNSLGEKLVQWSSLRDSFSPDLCRLVIGRYLKNQPVCPGCKVSLTDQEVDRLYADKRMICRHCGKGHSLYSGTVLEGVHADPRQIVLIAAMTVCDEPMKNIEQVTGLSDDTIRRIQRLRLGAK
jgi:transposase-like protein